MKRLRPITPADENTLAKLVKKYGVARIQKLAPKAKTRGPGRPSLGAQPKRDQAYFSIEVDERAEVYRKDGRNYPVKDAIWDIAEEKWPKNWKTMNYETLVRQVKAGRKYRKDHPDKFE